MKALSELLRDDMIARLRQKAAHGDFPGLDFKTAMNFLLADGVIPESGLPVDSFLRLEDWAREFARRNLSCTATEWKNKTGSILAEVQAGKTVTIYKHGRPVAEIAPIG
jgi:prevent-host-death family protein